MKTKFDNFTEFYPFYLSQHMNQTCRRLHFIGSLLSILVSLYIIYSQLWWLLISIPFIGYGIAWTGHFFFEHNRPATLAHPFYSFLGDWVMFKDILLGKIER